jgi:3'(2'), 5'-bisphosphate nucleotidase
VAEEDSHNLKQPERHTMLEQVTHFVQGQVPGASSEQVCDWIDLGGADAAQAFWTLDPIDGTAGFLRGEQYAVALALIEGGEVQIGLLACPNLSPEIGQAGPGGGVVFLAERGEGAYMMPLPGGELRRISVATPTQLQDAVVVESVESGHANHDAHQTLVGRLGILRPSVRIDSQAKYGVVARGDAAIYLRLPSGRTPDYREKIWDHAAGALIVEEAGGRVTDATGTDLDFGRGRTLLNNRGVVVSSGAIHSDLLDALSSMDI